MLLQNGFYIFIYYIGRQFFLKCFSTIFPKCFPNTYWEEETFFLLPNIFPKIIEGNRLKRNYLLLNNTSRYFHILSIILLNFLHIFKLTCQLFKFYSKTTQQRFKRNTFSTTNYLFISLSYIPCTQTRNYIQK